MLGSIVTRNGRDFVVALRGGNEVLEPFNDDAWHEDTFLIGGGATKALEGLQAFVEELTAACTAAFPGLTLTPAEQLELGLVLWKRFHQDVGAPHAPGL